MRQTSTAILEQRAEAADIPQPGQDDAFDVVVAAEAIEHLENIRFMVREIYRLPRPGGTSIVTTPNNESWRSPIAILVRGHFGEFGEAGYPAHIPALVCKGLMRIFKEAFFPTPSLQFTNSAVLPGKPLPGKPLSGKPMLRWQQIGFRMLNGRRYGDNNLTIANKPAVL